MGGGGGGGGWKAQNILGVGTAILYRNKTIVVVARREMKKGARVMAA